MTPAATAPQVRPVSARTALVRILLVADPPTLTSRQICAATTLVGYPESTIRVAVSRMVTAGELRRADGTYTLDPALHARRTDLALPTELPWTGDWEQALVTTTGRSPADRAALRATLLDLRLAELREGVWMRPANLARPWPDTLTTVTPLRTHPVPDPRALAARLWDLDSWSTRATALLTALRTPDPTDRFAAACAVIEHLRTDPVLPESLHPPAWPAAPLRRVCTDYLDWFAATLGHPFHPPGNTRLPAD
ncbi:PaaX family transcriptional regulator C-terminal domain-containing protein [Nocardia thailandica]